MSPATAGLSTQDVESIRASLESGRHPRVQFTDAAGQIVGQFGQVVELTDPDGSEDFLVVRFGRDELPFSPGDLTIPARGAGSAKSASAKAAKASTPTKTTPTKATEPQPAGPPLLPSPREEKTDMPTSKPPAAAVPAPASPVEEPAASAAPAPRKATKQARPKAPAGLTVTLAYTEGEWTVAALQGSKTLAKPYVIKPTDALKMVAMLDVAGVHEAVEAIVANERAEAKHHAERLRAELAEIEAKLAELGLDS